MSTQAWYERLRLQVDQSGQTMQRITFSYASANWHVWERPQVGNWPEPEDWQSELDTMCSEYAEQWPTKLHQCFLIAENKNGTVISQCPLSVQGRNKAANSVGQDGSGLKMHLDMMQTLQATWEKTLNVVNGQLETQSKQMKQWGDQVVDLMKYVREAEEYRATEARRKLDETKGAEPDPLKEQLVEAMPMILEIGKHWATTQIDRAANAALGNSPAGKVAKAAVEAVVSETINQGQ